MRPVRRFLHPFVLIVSAILLAGYAYIAARLTSTVLGRVLLAAPFVIVWILPVLVLGLGTAGVVFALARNRREPRLHATPADEDLIARERVEEP